MAAVGARTQLKEEEVVAVLQELYTGVYCGLMKIDDAAKEQLFHQWKQVVFVLKMTSGNQLRDFILRHYSFPTGDEYSGPMGVLSLLSRSEDARGAEISLSPVTGRVALGLGTTSRAMGRIASRAREGTVEQECHCPATVCFLREVKLTDIQAAALRTMLHDPNAPQNVLDNAETIRSDINYSRTKKTVEASEEYNYLPEEVADICPWLINSVSLVRKRTEMVNEQVEMEF